MEIEGNLGDFPQEPHSMELWELKALPHIPRTPELLKFIQEHWPLLRGPTGQILGYAVPVSSGCWLETPEGFDFAKDGDYLIYITRSRTLWVVSKLFCDALNWSLKDRSENGQAFEGTKLNGHSKEQVVPGLPDETQPKLF